MITPLLIDEIKVKECPHCKKGHMMWDKRDKEPYCLACGWRHAIPLTEDQSKSRFRSEKDFWNNLFTSFEANGTASRQ